MSSSRPVRFLKYDQAFDKIIGTDPSATVLCESESESLFHEACIYHQDTGTIWVTSNQLNNPPDDDYEATSNKHVKLFKVHDKTEPLYEEFTFPGYKYAMLNGGVNYGPDSILLCAQGSKSKDDLSGLLAVSIRGDTSVHVVVADFHGLPFNSVNDVVVHPLDGSIWFTDPCYGYHQKIRNQPVLPNQIYRYDPATQQIRAMADGFVRPNGICFSHDLQNLYVTDTGAIHGSEAVPVDLAGPSHIYAFDVLSMHGEPALVNRRLFAYAPGRFPDGIKCDTQGNVYSGCGDGINVWDVKGDLLGVIAISGGVANFCFGERGCLYACNEKMFWKIRLNQETVRGALLGI